VKVFSATMARHRDTLGDRVMAWLEEHPELETVQVIVSQSSDDRFHCLSIVLLCANRA
jgi:hypothetical protein